jgi:hypothetical protein
MAGLDPATQRNRYFTARTRVGWMAASRAAMTKKYSNCATTAGQNRTGSGVRNKKGILVVYFNVSNM